MKVTPKNNRIMMKIVMATIIISLILFGWHLGLYFPSYYATLILEVIDIIFYLLALWYLISILQFTHQSQTVNTPFYMLLGVNILLAFEQIFAISSLQFLGILNIAVSFYVFIASFRIKSQYISLPFKLFAFLLLLSLLFRLLIPTLALNKPTTNIFMAVHFYFALFNLLLSACLGFIILGTGKLLNEDSKRFEKTSDYPSVDTESIH